MSNKPVIKITYFGVGVGEPKVELPSGLDVELQFVDAFERDTLVLEWNGVCVFRAVKDVLGDEYETSENWLATRPGADYDGDEVFDRRDLPYVPDDDRRRLRNHLDETVIPIAHAIDQGWITKEGYREPTPSQS